MTTRATYNIIIKKVIGYASKYIGVPSVCEYVFKFCPKNQNL